MKLEILYNCIFGKNICLANLTRLIHNAFLTPVHSFKNSKEWKRGDDVFTRNFCSIAFQSLPILETVNLCL